MRRDVSFRSKGLLCRGWLYVPDGLAQGQTAPAVVMAHGFSGVKEMFLARRKELKAIAQDYVKGGEWIRGAGN